MDKIKCLVNMIFACILYPFTKSKFKNKRIWLIGGNAGELDVDNGRAMYEYLRTKKEVETYWVINKDSPVFEQIPGNKLIRGSVKDYLYFMNSEVVLFSHSISADIVPYLFAVPFIKGFHYKPIKVFLNHGTVGFKVRMAMNKKTEKIAEELVRSYDINICDSEYESVIKRDAWWNIEGEKIFVTGYPRYDKLYNAEIKENEILFMPTWRNWIKSENLKIEDTEYFKNITGLVTDGKLNEYLERKGILLNLYIHQLMHDYLGNFGSIKLGKNIRLLPKEAEITKELMKARILITDYSSVAYDFYYLDKPIIFFQFDKKEYTEKVGSYVDLDNELFGKEAYTIEECVKDIIEISENNFKYDGVIEEKSEKLKDKFLKYNDKDNCKRVYELILSKIGEKNDKR